MQTHPRSVGGIGTGSRIRGALRRAVAGATPRLGSARRPAGSEPLERRVLLSGSVVINEIHYNPDVDTEAVEFVELTNPGDAPVNLGGAAFTNGIGYTFPAGMTLQPGGYVTVSENPTAFQTKFGTTALGPYTGGLSSEGETLTLADAAGNKLDEVDYGAGFPWPTVGDAPGYSIELINPTLDNNLGGNWRSYLPGTDTTFFPAGSTWDYRKGSSEASNPTSAWRNLSFAEDVTWTANAPTPIGYDSLPLTNGTTLSDMNGNYSSVFLRKTFTVTNPLSFTSLRLEASFDDGYNVWVNGQLAGSVNMPSATAAYNAVASVAREDNGFQPLTINPSLLQAGNNIIAVQFFNSGKSGSSDAFFDARLIGSTGLRGPTPGRQNAVFAANSPPQMRQVANTPQQPTAGQAVTVTAKVTDPNGVASVSLAYQLVDPGNYIATEDAAYSNPANWTTVAMHDDGINGDAAAGDGVYSVVLPAALQTNRRLVRYKITSVDGLGASVTGPYVDDPTPNFAYYVYNGVPGWSGAIKPGDATLGTVVNYPASTLTSFPTYQLITKKQDHIESQHLPGNTTTAYTGDHYLWSGTFVYDGVVYDNIHYRARGGTWRYAMGKNMWKIDFNNGHDFQPRDAYGNLYPVKWTKLNLGANIQQGDIGDRGEQGLFESVGFQMFNLAGVPAPYTTPAQFRIVENAAETDPTNQYNGDFQGLYLAVEQPNGRFLDAHGLPDGNYYKMESGTGPGGGTLNNQGPTQPSDNSDLVAFTAALASSSTTDQWFRDNVDLDSFYSFQAVVEMIHHYDIGFGKNYYYYHNPDTNKWSILPWDLDLTWYVNYQTADTSTGGTTPFASAILSRAAFKAEYRNRLRELRDLFYNNEQLGQLADAYAALVSPPGAATTVLQADRAMWDYNPILASSAVNPNKAGQGRFYQNGSPTKDFAGMVARLKSWAGTSQALDGSKPSRMAFIDNTLITAAEEAAAPAKPTVSYTGPAGFAADALTFSASAFAPGNLGGTFAGMQWRLADVTAVPAGQVPHSEITAAWQSPTLTTYTAAVTVPAGSVIPGHTYRVRVRVKDSNGRWGHWSDVAAGATQFVAGAASSAVSNYLRVTEMNYNPTPSGSYLSEDLEFIELMNTSSSLTLDLSGVKFSAGITYTFAAGATLGPGQRLVLGRNTAALQSRYPGLTVFGLYTGKLDNSGEQVKLETATGVTILDFDFTTCRYAQTDGGGYSLVIVDPTAPAGTWGTKASWRPSVKPNGDPAAADPPPAWLTPPAGGQWAMSGPTGGQTLTLSSGAFTVGADPNATFPNLSVVVNSPATLKVTADVHLAALTLNGAGAKVLFYDAAGNLMLQFSGAAAPVDVPVAPPEPTPTPTPVPTPTPIPIPRDPPQLVVGDVSHAEGNGGVTTFSFPVTLDRVSDTPVRVYYSTANGTAARGSDYAAAAGVLVFQPGESAKTIRVQVKGDTQVEGDETFRVVLYQPTGATLAGATGVGTIRNDDALPPPRVSVADAAVTEGDKGARAVTFDVTLDRPAAAAVTVHYATADGTAKAGSDYLAAAGTLTFSKGETRKRVTVYVAGDKAKEANETFFLNLTAPVGITLGRQGKGTIRNDD